MDTVCHPWGLMSSPFSPPGVYILDALLVFVDARDALFRSSSPTCVYVVSCGIVLYQRLKLQFFSSTVVYTVGIMFYLFTVCVQ